MMYLLKRFRTTSVWKRFLSLCLALAMLLAFVPAVSHHADAAVAGDTLYLKPNANWCKDGARFAAYFFGTAGYVWVGMSDTDADGYYEVTIPEGAYANVIFCRMSSSATANNWDNKWNQTADLVIPTSGSNNCYTVKEGTWDKGGGTWSAYTPAGSGDGTVIPPAAGTTLYFVPGSQWGSDAARYAVYFFADDETNAWADLTDADGDGYYEAVIPEGGFTKAIFCRMDGATAQNNWENKYNQTLDQTLDAAYNCFTMDDATQWDAAGANGSWSKYNPATVDPEDPGFEASSYIIAGNNTVVFGTAWDVSNTANAMQLNTATGIYEKTYYSVPICNLAFKVTDGSWSNCWGDYSSGDPDGNYLLAVTEISDVTIYFDASSYTITTSVVPTGEVPVPVTYATVHYRNTGGWSAVNGYAWNLSTNEVYNGSWPGEALTETEGHTNWYTLSVSDVEAESGLGFIFNDGTSQTGDINIMKSGEYWYDGGLSTTAPASWEDGSVELADYTVRLHFANLNNWGSVYLYTWGAYSTGGWPGVLTGQDEDGFYSAELKYSAIAGQGLNFIFSGGGQTVDLALKASDFVDNVAEKWVVPTTTDAEGKYYADIVASPEAIAVSPIVKDRSVTFKYKGSTRDTVTLFGSMNDWASGYEMTANAYGVFSVTLEDLDYGIYEYKFVVNDNWLADPSNAWQQNGNSAFLISNPELDDNIVTLNIHYNRADGVYDYWNVHAWSLNFVEELRFDDSHTATIEVEGRSTGYISFIIRKSVGSNKWAAQLAQQSVDLSNVVSGTIDMYITVNADGSLSVYQTKSEDLVTCNKVSQVNLDYDANTIAVTTTKTVSDPETAFTLYYTDPATGETVATDLIRSVSATGSTYTFTLAEEMDLVTLYRYTIRFNEQVKFSDYDYSIGIVGVYASDKFAEQFTYLGGDLGAEYAVTGTTFKVWAPTAELAEVKLYTTGSDEEAGAAVLGTYAMTKGDKGEWTVQIPGDLKNVYYVYRVLVNGETVEACDPYARATGVNGNRAMVVDLDSTDPEGWNEDSNPNPIESYTDAVLYELHVRDFSIDDSSGISEANRGKYLAFTERGTTTSQGTPTGLDHLKYLGITHLHLLPVYDYATVDESSDEAQFNWGYDPKNYNVPEGSYSTDPFNGAVRVNEFKQMVQSLHHNGISVVMDVVYNHVYDAGTFCYNQIVPGYFSRQNADGSYSNGSGCGNDTASEREMVRDYIVDSVLYWAEEYHIDGFRFDLVGLIDTTTINEIVDTVHAVRPDVIFYGEGWTMGTAVEKGNVMATQINSAQTPGFAYFSDTIRNLLGGSNGSSTGFASGSLGRELEIVDNFKARPSWSNNPTQIVQYASCHDNYTLVDKIILSTGRSSIDSTVIKMNNLAAAVYMTSQGIPFIHAGEDFLREKLEEDGGRCENSYNAPDFVNHLEWSDLDNSTYAANSAYYKGLIEFRKAHPALRFSTAAEITTNVSTLTATGGVVAMKINGKVNGEPSDAIIVIYNNNSGAKTVNLPSGTWKVCIEGTTAGNTALREVSGSVSVSGISTTVLVLGELDNGECTHRNTTTHIEEATCVEAGRIYDLCADCGETLYEEVIPATGHMETTTTTVDATCTEPGAIIVTCDICGEIVSEEPIAALGHSYEIEVTAATCTEDGYTTYTCSVCGDSYVDDTVAATGHSYVDGVCTACGEEDPDYLPENPFADVKEGDYCYTPILWALKEGVTTGTTATTFSPNDPCTRGQIVTFLWRASGSPEPTQTENPFTDVPENMYYYKAILWAVEQGITTGTTATTFSPEDTCTRGQVATFLWRACGKPAPESEEAPFTDVNSNVYYYEPILWAVEAGVTNGTGEGKFSPEDSCTRGQIVTFLYRALAE